MMRILIYDDDQNWANGLKEKLENKSILGEDSDITIPDTKDFKNLMQTLQHRQLSFRKTGDWQDDGTPLDKADIFIIDYDLLETDPFLTGEDAAYFARCFSNCGVIVALNQLPIADFDLTLKGRPASFADLNIPARQLSNSNLWGKTGDEFRPWYWPILPQHRNTFEKRIEDVRQNLDSPIYEILGFDPDLFDMLPRSISQFLGDEPTKATFRSFVMKSDQGLRLKDRPPNGNEANGNVLARVGAARISKWLERLVLPELDIFIDAPHLVSRYPSLMTGNPEDIKTWNKTTQLASYTELGLNTDIIEPFRLDKEYWLSRPVWFWDKLRECEEILEVSEPWKTVRTDWVFCEDMSRFWVGDYREFVADVESPFARRFVRYFDDFEYRPKVRFSL